MTVGSFVCTSCSGILRGLNPPHRVKSISMASFTQEEIEQIKSKGNQYCGAIWLGLYDAKISPFPDTKDEHKIRDFMIMKYEKKRFYIEPSIALKNMPPQNTSATSSNASTPNSETSKVGPTVNSSVSRPNVTASQSSGSVSGSLNSATNTGSKNSTPKSSTSLDLLADLGNQPVSSVNSNDPFASPTSSQAPTSVSQPSFANFENANIFTNTLEEQFSQSETESTCETLTDQPCTLSLNPPPCPAQTPSPRLSPSRFNWEAFEEDVNPGTPLIPMSEAFRSATISCDASNRPTNKQKSYPTLIFASGVSAQYVYPTYPTLNACPKEEDKVSSSTEKQSLSFSNSSVMSSEQSLHASLEPRPSQANSSPTATKNVRVSQVQAKSTHLHGSPFQSRKKLPSGSKGLGDFAYSALNVDLPHSDTVRALVDYNDVPESTRSYFHLNAKSNEISSKCFAAFLSSTNKLRGTSYQNLASGSRQISSDLEKKKNEEKSLDRECESPKSRMVSNMPAPEVDNIVKTNPFLSEGASLSSTNDENAIFDNAPLFTEKRGEASKPIPIINKITTSSSLSSSFPSACPPRASLFTNPFVSFLQPATNARQDPPMASSAVGRVGSLGGFSSSDMFLHENLGQQQQPFHCNTDISMTSANYVLAGTTTSNKSTSLGPQLPFSNNPLTPMVPGSSSNPPSSTVHNTQSCSNTPMQDRYAALKDLDEEFKTQKESETMSNGGSSWPIPNGSHQSSSVFGSSTSALNGTVFGSPGTTN
ncbi:hypothetical protein OTU49_011296, partial [Cherax quadricarinatus]